MCLGVLYNLGYLVIYHIYFIIAICDSLMILSIKHQSISVDMGAAQEGKYNAVLHTVCSWKAQKTDIRKGNIKSSNL